MPDITNPQAVRFANERIRPLADLLEAAYETAKRFKAEWDANNLAALIPNTADPVVDGAATDGRKPMTGQKAHNLYNRASELITELEGGSLAALAGRLDTIKQVSVNGGPHF
jgi:hypothetical protein